MPDIVIGILILGQFGSRGDKEQTPLFFHRLGDPFRHIFRIPIEWVVTYSDVDSRPDLKEKARQEKWINEETELKQYLDNLGLLIDSFQWSYRNITHTNNDGTEEPAIKAVGSCTVLCVLRALTAPDPNDPARRQLL